MPGNYKKILFRLTFVSLYAVTILSLFRLIIRPMEVPVNLWFLYVLYIICYNIASEGNLVIDRILNKKMPWLYFAGKRIYIQLIVTILLTTIIVFIPFAIRFWFVESKNPNPQFPAFILFSFFFGVILLIVFDAIYIAIDFFNNWKKSLLELELTKQEKLKADYKLLMDQLNPHFLFNSLNVLISEITYNQKNAIEFARKLSLVYRYILQSNKSELICLQDELDFVKSYIYLHKVRAGEAIQIEYEIPEDIKSKSLPPHTLQILIENAIKHNKYTPEQPLRIKIGCSAADTVYVINTLRPKTAVDSTGTGLSNIRARYRLLGNFNVDIEKNKNDYKITVPLIDN